MTQTPPDHAPQTDSSVDETLWEPFFLRSEKDVSEMLSAAQSLCKQHLQTKEGLIQQLKSVVDALCQVEQRLSTLDLQLGRLYYTIGASGYPIPISLHPQPLAYTISQHGENNPCGPSQSAPSKKGQSRKKPDPQPLDPVEEEPSPQAAGLQADPQNVTNRLGCPQRQRISRIDKLAKESEVIGGDLMRVMEKTRGHKHKPSNSVDPGLVDIPDDAPPNSMAPAVKKQRMALPSKKRMTMSHNENTAGLTSTNPFANVATNDMLSPPLSLSQAHALLNRSSNLSKTSSQQPQASSKTPSQQPQAALKASSQPQASLAAPKYMFGQQKRQLGSIYEDNDDTMMYDHPDSIGEAHHESVANQPEDKHEGDWASMQPSRFHLQHIFLSDSESDQEGSTAPNDNEAMQENKGEDYEGAQEDNWEEISVHNNEDGGDFGNENDDNDHDNYNDDPNDDDDRDDDYDGDYDNHNGENLNDDVNDYMDTDAGLTVDEQSPSEADQEANEALQAPVVDNIDVLDDHRARNKDCRPPQEECLTKAARQQNALTGLIRDIQEDPFEAQDIEEDHEDEGEGAQSEDDDSTDVHPKRAPRNSRHSDKRSPTTLAFYHGPWKMVLASSKLHWRCNLAIGNAWPSCQNDLHFVKAILMRLLHYQGEGVVFDDEFEVDRHMLILDVVPDEYEGNQLVVYDAVIERVKAMLDDGTYHHGLEKDSLGKTNNFAHPCIGHVIQQFFYGKPDVITCSFPDDFSREVPLRVVALVATAIIACLEEYLATGKQRNLTFDSKGYHGTYNNIVAAINKVDADEYHGKKLQNMCCSWAAAGMALLKPVEEPKGRAVPVNLD
ncbi:hypothetical protein BJ165DRAFT_1534988 [Panaeolus papilionaceus]|nr:hypothetical protein BJ165DRAFT_1534988 [Panaeolus papilionaceus]